MHKTNLLLDLKEILVWGGIGELKDTITPRDISPWGNHGLQEKQRVETFYSDLEVKER